MLLVTASRSLAIACTSPQGTKDSLSTVEPATAPGRVEEHIYFGGRHVAIVNGTTPSYLFPDHLGGEHVVTNASGTICDDVDTLPFGGEIDYTASCGPSYIFAGMDRGNENSSDLDYAINRYYDLRVGRFMTPDWAGAPTDVPYAHFGNPQSLNLYGYVENNPTTLGDPDGHSASWADLFVTQDLGWASLNVPGVELMAQNSQAATSAQKQKPTNKPKPSTKPVQKPLVKADQPINPGPNGPAGGAQREVDYYATTPAGNAQGNHTLTLSEKFVGPHPPDQIICSPACVQTDPYLIQQGEFEDLQGVNPKNPFTVERRWTVDGKPAQVLDPNNKPFDYEVLHLSNETDPIFQLEYENDPK